MASVQNLKPELLGVMEYDFPVYLFRKWNLLKRGENCMFRS